MKDFQYLLDKINSAEFNFEPFKHVSIEDFFSEEHFTKIISDPQVNINKNVGNTTELISLLMAENYEPQPFPGCITSISDYIKFIDNKDVSVNRELIRGYGKEIIEGYGLTMRLKKHKSQFLTGLVAFFNSEEFLSCIQKKFDVEGGISVETAIQKNLSGYEISPHCDTKRKALTYMINIYTEDLSSQKLHTRLMKFKDKWRYLYDFWRYNDDVDTCWVPWDWCEEIKETSINNSIIIFRPSFETIHAVKLDYDHLKTQRNQIYGNLWYEQSPHKYAGDYKVVDMPGSFEGKYKEKSYIKIKNKIKRGIRKLL